MVVSGDLMINDLEKGFDEPNLNPVYDCLRLFLLIYTRKARNIVYLIWGLLGIRQLVNTQFVNYNNLLGREISVA